MNKAWMFAVFTFLISICTQGYYSKKHAEITSIFQNNKRLRRDASFQNKLTNLRSLLNDPIDEEHGDLPEESSDTHAYEWVVRLSTDDENIAQEIGKKHGFDHIERIELRDEFDNSAVFRFSHNEDEADSARKAIPSATDDGYGKFSSKNSKREEMANNLQNEEHVQYFKRSRTLVREKRDGLNLNDPEFKQEWYIRNVGQTSGPSKFDSGVYDAWTKLGLSGKGVKVSILDDGLDHTHPDLKKNYDPQLSRDMNGHDLDPMPNDSDPYNAHGTKCAGTVAAEAGNGICGVGIAFNAKIGGIRMLDGKATDGLEADALSFHRNLIDIYSNSWGPRDNGRTFGRPGQLGLLGLAQGVKLGRNGKGSIFVWATGNGGLMADDCNADGYVNSPYTLSIGAVNEHGVSTYYGERCPSKMAVTYCSGSHTQSVYNNAHANVITTYLHHQCTDHFVGTSSAAPLAAGIIALALEANPNLTWRDIQHLVYKTALKTSPMDLGWKTNGCGRSYNHKFGFGVLNAYDLAQAAANWTTVAERRSCHFKLNYKNGDIPSRHHFKLSFTTEGCQCKDPKKVCKNAINKLEHVVVNVTLKHRRRGDLSIDLISPAGTVSHLLHPRRYDDAHTGLKGWMFMSLFNWCENPAGTWQLIFKDNDVSQPFERNTRDMEDEYIKELDAMKKKEQKRDESESVQTTEERVYDKMDDSTKHESSTSFRNNAFHDYMQRREFSDEFYRSKRSVDDYVEDVIYKKDISDTFKVEYKDDVLKKSVLAGEVKHISVTFYGTFE